ncbi:hypothetical protein [Microbacterium aurum]
MTLAAQRAQQIEEVGDGDLGGIGVVLLQAREQDAVLALRGVGGGLVQSVEELGDGAPAVLAAAADHARLGLVVGPVAVAEQTGPLRADGEEFGQNGVVLGPGEVVVGGDDRRAGGAVAGVLAHRHEVGVVGGEHDEAVVADGMRVEEVLRQPRERLGRHADLTAAVADVAGEGQAQLRVAVGELAHAFALGVGKIDAAAAEILEHLREQAPLLVVEGCGGGVAAASAAAIA